MEVPYNQEPFARPRYGYIVTDAGHGEQRVEEKPCLCTEGKSVSLPRRVSGWHNFCLSVPIP